MQETQKHPITHLELHLPVRLVILKLGLLLCLLQLVPDLDQELIALHHLLVHRRELGVARPICRNSRWITAVHDPEWRNFYNTPPKEANEATVTVCHPSRIASTS